MEDFLLTRSLRLLQALGIWCACAAPALAQAAPSSSSPSPSSNVPPAASESRSAQVDTTTLEAERLPMRGLPEHFIGSTARAVRFDWRRSTAIPLLQMADVAERNNFAQFQANIAVRKAFGDILVEGGLGYFWATDTDSSLLLAQTPFRQAGRPSHIALDVNVGYPIAEGVVTPVVSWMPPAELVLVAWAGARYSIFVETFTGGRPFQDIGLDLVAPQLSAVELQRLDDNAPDAMEIDPARIHTPVGLSLDVYLQPGVVISPRAMLDIPVLAPVTGTKIGLFWELGLSVGYAL